MSVHVDVGAGYGQAGIPRGLSRRSDVGNSRVPTQPADGERDRHGPFEKNRKACLLARACVNIGAPAAVLPVEGGEV